MIESRQKKAQYPPDQGPEGLWHGRLDQRWYDPIISSLLDNASRLVTSSMNQLSFNGAESWDAPSVKLERQAQPELYEGSVSEAVQGDGGRDE